MTPEVNSPSDTSTTGPSNIALRANRYETLFLGELQYAEPPESSYFGISSLCRITKLSGTLKQELYGHLDNLPGIINDILVEHDLMAMDCGEATFAFVDDDSRETVTPIVADIFRRWEIAYSRSDLDILLPDKDSPAKWLVVEAAAAVMFVAGEAPSLDIQKNKDDRKLISKIISSWGPLFAKQWLDGTIARQWMESEGVPVIEQDEWLEVLNPSTRKHLAKNYAIDPLKAFRQMKESLETSLTDEAIAESLGWSEVEVREVFTPHIRKHLAVTNMVDPLTALGRVRENLETRLTDEAIAKSLGWSEDEARKTFTPHIRKHFAVYNIADPLTALGRVRENLETRLTDEAIAKSLGWSEEMVQEIFVQAVRNHFAVHNISNPIQACRDWIAGTLKAGTSYDDTKNRKLTELGIYSE